MISAKGYMVFKDILSNEILTIIPEFKKSILKSVCNFHLESGILYKISFDGFSKAYSYMSDNPLHFLPRNRISDLYFEKIIIQGVDNSDFSIMSILEFVHHVWNLFFDNVLANIKHCLMNYTYDSILHDDLVVLSNSHRGFHLIDKLLRSVSDLLCGVLIDLGSQEIESSLEDQYQNYEVNKNNLSTILKLRRLPPQYRKLITEMVVKEPTFIHCKADMSERTISSIDSSPEEFMKSCVDLLTSIGAGRGTLTMNKRSPISKGIKKKYTLYSINSFYLDKGYVDFIENSESHQYENSNGIQRIFDFNQYIYL